MSLFVLVSEMTLGFQFVSNKVLSTIFVEYLNSMFLNVVILTLMAYIVYATLYGLFKIKIWGLYSLH